MLCYEKIITRLTLFTFFTTFSQDYIPMLQEDNVWHIAFFQCCDTGGSYPYMIDEIIEIDGVQYKTFDYFGNSCLFREENGLVYKRDDDGNDYVYFDFTLETGDTFDATNHSNDDCIELEDFNDTYRSRCPNRINIWRNA